jgi:hypothetical protein
MFSTGRESNYYFLIHCYNSHRIFTKLWFPVSREFRFHLKFYQNLRCHILYNWKFSFKKGSQHMVMDKKREVLQSIYKNKAAIILI